MAVAQNLTLRRPHPHPAPGLLGSLDPINGSGENPGVAATNRAIPCRFENNFGHERHSTGLPGIRQLGVEGQVSGERGLEARNCTRTLRSTATKAAVSGNQTASGGFRLPNGNWAAGTTEEDDMREGSGAFHQAAFLCSVLALAIAAPAIAEDSEGSKKRGAPRARGFDQYDTDGDGRLSDEERTAARDKRHKQRLEEFDADGDGEISQAEKSAAHKTRTRRYLENFDEDGDGNLSEAEMRAARGTRREHRIEKFDTDADGKLSEEERRAAQEKHSNRKTRGLERFDADGDGKLTGEEKEREEAARKERRERRGRGPGERPAVDQPGNAPQEP
jgi:Ca2+-binding EF-hand superfamily protein